MPEGWLLEQLQMDLAEGIAGHFPQINKTIEHRRFVKHDARPDNIPHVADDDQQRGWWSGEHEAYYADGYFRTAWLAGDQYHTQKAIGRLKAILAAQDRDGYIGIYSREHRLPSKGPDGELWTQSRIFQALLAYYEATGDRNILDAVERAVRLTAGRYMARGGYFSRPGSKDGGVSHGVGYFQTLEWLYRLTGDDFYRSTFLRLYQDYARGDTRDLDMLLSNLADSSAAWTDHTPHTAESLAVPRIAQAYGDTAYRQAAANVLYKIDKYSNPGGGMVGDESIHGRTGSFDLPTEYCTFTETVESMNRMDMYQHPFTCSDRIERIAFNGAQGARLHPAAGAVAYLSLDNRTEARLASRLGDRHLFSPSHTAASCCALNSMRFLPYYIEGMWMKATDGRTLFARLYGACRVETKIGGRTVTVREITDYPFGGKIRFEIFVERPVYFRLALHIPAYVTDEEVSVPAGMRVRRNGASVEIEGRWKGNESVELELPFAVRPVTDSRDMTAAAYGPLLFSLPIDAQVVRCRNYTNDSLFFSREYLPVEQPSVWRIDNVPEFSAIALDSGDMTRPWAYPPVGLSGVLTDTVGLKKPVVLRPLGSTILRQTGFRRSE